MTGSWPPPARHSLVWLASGPTTGPAAEHWNRALPYVLCRPRSGEELSLGFCRPSRGDAKPSRHALAARMADVGLLAPPPLLREVASVLHPLEALLPVATGNNPRVVGSAMWEYLTGENFLRKTSDMDLVWGLEAGDDPGIALDFFRRADALLPNRVDGEIGFPGRGEVAWREWASSSQTVLVKSMTQLAILPRQLLLEQHNTKRPPGSPLADAAVAALLEELELYPKPGLVSRHDTGSHTDMDAGLMRKSATTLHEFFAEIEANPGDFSDCLKPVGIRAERRMLQATQGVNTHRGAIFLLGLLVAAAARTRQKSPAAIRESLLTGYGPALLAHENEIAHSGSHGAEARKVNGSAGARGEAARGFPSVFELALPHFSRLQAAGTCRQAAALDTLMLLISRAEDSNLVHRGGMPGASRARQSALKFLQAGGVLGSGWFQGLQKLHGEFVQERLSPGGCADLLAAVLFLDRIHSTGRV